MSKATKFVARYEGEIIGTRRSPRPYTHAVITQDDEETARQAAHLWTPSELDKRDFEWETFKASCTVGVEVRPAGWNFSTRFKAEEIEASRERIAGDWPAYVARRKAWRIKCFEDSLAAGRFKPRVFGWSMSERNAQKMASGVNGMRVLAIVPAEVA